MSNSTRHMACGGCREKKVRCDGEQPSCTKCLRTGEKCTYVPPTTPSRADLAQTIGELQHRLAQAEAQLSVRPISCHSQHHVQQSQIDITSNMATSSFPIGNIFSSTTGNSPTITDLCDDMNDNYLFSSMLNTPRATHLEPRFDIPATAETHNDRLPNLHELRALNDRGKSLPDLLFCSGMDKQDLQSFVLGPLSDFFTIVYSTQVNIAGLSGAMADYLSYAQKVTFNSDQSSSSPQLLQTLESRAREIKQLASSKYSNAFSCMCLALIGDETIRTPLLALERRLNEQSLQSLQFFHEDYDVSLSLEDQSFG